MSVDPLVRVLQAGVVPEGGGGAGGVGGDVPGPGVLHRLLGGGQGVLPRVGVVPPGGGGTRGGRRLRGARGEAGGCSGRGCLAVCGRGRRRGGVLLIVVPPE